MTDWSPISPAQNAAAEATSTYLANALMQGAAREGCHLRGDQAQWLAQHACNALLGSAEGRVLLRTALAAMAAPVVFDQDLDDLAPDGTVGSRDNPADRGRFVNPSPEAGKRIADAVARAIETDQRTPDGRLEIRLDSPLGDEPVHEPVHEPVELSRACDAAQQIATAVLLDQRRLAIQIAAEHVSVALALYLADLAVYAHHRWCEHLDLDLRDTWAQLLLAAERDRSDQATGPEA